MLGAAGFNASLVTPKNDVLWPSAKLPVSWSIGIDGWYLACHRALIFSLFLHIKPNSMGWNEYFWSFWVWVMCVLRQRKGQSELLLCTDLQQVWGGGNRWKRPHLLGISDLAIQQAHKKNKVTASVQVCLRFFTDNCLVPHLCLSSLPASNSLWWFFFQENAKFYARCR